MFRLVYVVRNVACHRSLPEFKSRFCQNYWILIFNNFLDMVVLEWCKVFGSRSEPTHWSSHIKEQNTFREGLLKRLGLSKEEWETYWDSVKDYRDNLVLHHKRNPNVTHYPNLEEYYQRCLAQMSEFSYVAYQSTMEIKETVDQRT